MAILGSAIKGVTDFVSDVSHNLRPGGLSQYFNKKSHQILPNGLTIDRCRSSEKHILSADVTLSTGWRHDPENQKGMAHFLEHMLFRSTSPRAQEMLHEFERRGGTRNGATLPSSTKYSFTIPAGAGNERLMHQLIREFVFNPQFSEEDMIREKEVVLNEIQRSEDNNGRKFGFLLTTTATGTPSTESPGLGTPESLYGITLEDLKNFHKRAYTANNTTISLEHTGDAAKLLTNIKSAYSDLPVTPRTVRPLQEKPYTGGYAHLDTPGQQQLYVTTAFLLPQGKPHDKKHEAMNFILGHYLHTMLYDATRKEENMLYAITAEKEHHRDIGKDMLSIHASTRPERAQEVLPIIAKILSDFSAGKIDTHKFNSAVAVAARDMNVDLKPEPQGYAKILRDAANLGARALMHERKTIYISPQDIKQSLTDYMLAHPPTLITAGNADNVQSYQTFCAMLPKTNLESPAAQSVARTTTGLKAASSVPG